MNQKRRETTTVATPAQLRNETPIAVPAVDFVAAHPVVTVDAFDVLRRLILPLLLIAVFALAFPLGGCATVATPAHPSPRAQAVAKCLAAEDAGQPTPGACKALAPDVAALRLLSTMAGRS